jgi:hypothetical protein
VTSHAAHGRVHQAHLEYASSTQTRRPSLRGNEVDPSRIQPPWGAVLTMTQNCCKQFLVSRFAVPTWHCANTLAVVEWPAIVLTPANTVLRRGDGDR